MYHQNEGEDKKERRDYGKKQGRERYGKKLDVGRKNHAKINQHVVNRACVVDDGSCNHAHPSGVPCPAPKNYCKKGCDASENQFYYIEN